MLQVSDFGLSRRDDSGRGYQLQSAQKLPLRWLAPECFTKRSWTKASDVWSFGILMYEVFTNGCEPYADMNLDEAKDLSKHISRGGHPSEIPGLNPLMRETMLSCWKLKEEDRPTMEQLRDMLAKAYPRIADCIDRPCDVADCSMWLTGGLHSRPHSIGLILQPATGHGRPGGAVGQSAHNAKNSG
uniref:Protein kinase domain-containing protein n=1 Tax=Romanomermis culicivorax TaxID=13658 RepID=A0A915HPA4_ROMCU